MKLSKEEIAKVFAMYLGCMGVIYVNGNEYNQVVTLNTVTNIISETHLYRLLLSPLNNITEEHIIEIGDIVFGERRKANYKIMRYANFITLSKDNFWELQIWFDGSFLFPSSSHVNPIEVSQILMWRGYAVPLFFAPNHWANGKTPLDLGIAISKNEVK